MNLHRTLAAALVICALVVVTACSGDKRTPEQQIAARIEEGVEALEKRDLDAAGDILSESYRDAMGRDRKKLKGLAFVVLRGGPVLLSVSDQRIVVDEGGQKAHMTAKVTALQSTAGAGATVADLVPRGRAFDVTIAFAKEGDDWLVTAIDGDGFGGDEL